MKIGIIVPAYNEEKILENNIKELNKFFKKKISSKFEIIISDNGSSDNTKTIGKELEKNNKNIKYIRTEKKGKGRAIKNAIKNYEFDRYILIDADLPFDLDKIDFEKLLNSKIDFIVFCKNNGKNNFSITRKIVSRTYSLMVKTILLNPKIKETQTGLKIFNKKIRNEIFLKKVKDNYFFFDTELVYYSHKKKKKVVYQNVDIINDRKSESKINTFKLAPKFVKDLIKLKLRDITGKWNRQKDKST